MKSPYYFEPERQTRDVSALLSTAHRESVSPLPGASYSDDLRGLSKLTTVRGFEEIIMPNSQVRDWRTDGVKVIKSDRLDSNTPQTPGMLRAAAINAARGAQKIWAGTVVILPNAKTGAHHHGALE